MTGTHRRTPVLRRSVAAAVILAAGSTGAVLGLRDIGAGSVARPSFTDTFPATLGPSVIAGPSVSIGPAPVHTRRYVLASPAVRGTDTVPAQVSASASAPVSAPVSVSAPFSSSPLVRSSTPVQAPVSPSVSPSVSTPEAPPTTPSGTGNTPTTPGSPADSTSASSGPPGFPDGSATWTLQQWLDWLRHHRRPGQD